MDDSETDYLLTIKGPDMDFKKQITLQAAVSALQAAIGVQPTAPVLMPTQAPLLAEVGNTMPVSLREYFDKVNARKKIEQILAIADWRTSFDGVENVSREDIRASFADAREPLPANFPRDFNDVLRKGWLASTHTDKSRFYVTATGNRALTEGFK